MFGSKRAQIGSLQGTNRRYTGSLKGVILDWAGTTVDYGCASPAQVFVEVFAGQGVPISVAEARAPMGMGKRDHIRTVTNMESVARRWTEVKGRPPTEEDVDALYGEFEAKQQAILGEHCDLIPGVAETISAYRARGLKIGTSTGYTREMIGVVAAKAADQGFIPDAIVCSTDVPNARPAPAMCFQNMILLDLYPMEACVKIGDTVADIEEGLNAGMWVIALAKTGNELGLTLAEVEALPPDELAHRLDIIYEHLYQAGAHYVVDSLSDTLPLLDEIERRLMRGDRP